MMILLAKSDPTDPQRSLLAHTFAVKDNVVRLRQLYPLLSERLIAAALFHDFGKAASGFQKSLQPDATAWGFRHEVLSAQIFRECFAVFADDNDLYYAYLALLTHHKNLGSKTTVGIDFLKCQDVEGGDWLKRWNELLIDDLRTTFTPTLDDWQFRSDVPSPADEALSLIKQICQMPTVFQEPALALARGALVAADHLASSGIGETNTGENLTFDSLQKYAGEHINGWQQWSAMQEKAQDCKGSALLTAPTGAGKTEAALLWALANRRPGERVFYVLPYQVSINAMAERLNLVFPPLNQKTGEPQKNISFYSNDTISVLHSNTDLAYLQDAMNDQLSLEDAVKVAQSKANAARKIYAPVKVTTVYQLLDIFFGHKFFEVGLLELTNSLVIFDEIHAYDGHTMGLILVLLDCMHKLGARVFIMTATLPNALKSKLQQAAQIPAENEIVLEKQDPLLEEVRRDIKRRDCSIMNLLDDIRFEVGAGKKTVVVCNTVDMAVQVYDALYDLTPLLVHSRFTLGDRAERETKDNIKAQSLVVSTQVIEVSLDVSFDVMFTQLAPADSLLQRFGRVKRHGVVDGAKRGQCHIACASDPGSNTIYGRELLGKTDSFIQKHLGTDAVEPKALDFSTACKWIEWVYPEGLSGEQKRIMEYIHSLFAQSIRDLRPMLDPPVTVELELTVFDSVQVVPIEFIQEWCDLKAARRHTEAKSLVVNISGPIWRGKVDKDPCGACYEVSYGSQSKPRKMIVACYPYDGATYGLRLDQEPLPKTQRINDSILGGDE